MPQMIGKFQILKTLGKGSMGEVLLGLDEVLGRKVAIKTVLPASSFGAEAKARFIREAKATASMNHPNIVTVFDFGEQDGLHYLVLELVEGQDLEALIQQGDLPKSDLLEVLAQTCEALAYAHERGIIHRDVKPGNILVTQSGKRVHAKLTDFGVALVDRSNLTDDGVWMGTVSYMAPEYLDTGKASPSSDLFAIGVMLYEILTGGRKPFTGETTTGILNAILRKSAEPLTPQETSSLSPVILEVARRALAKAPEDRYGSGEALAQAIRQAVAPQPTMIAAKTPPKAALPTGVPLLVGKGHGANCLSLRVALRQAPAGAHIKVLPGTYHESLVIDKDIIISAASEDGEVHLENLQGPCIRVANGSTTLNGCILHSAGKAAIECASGGASLQMDRCQVESKGLFGLSLEENASASITNCHFSGARQALIKGNSGATLTILNTQFLPSKAIGIQLDLGAQATLEDCELTELWGGAIEVGPDARVQVRRCKIHGSQFAGLLALEKSSVTLEDCTVSGHAGSGLHATGRASVQVRNCRFEENPGFGISVLDHSTLTMDACEIIKNEQAGVLIHLNATAQLKDCKITDGKSFGLICSQKGRGVMEGCEIAGNAQSGAKVEPGGSLLLVRCVVRDGQDTGIVLFQDGEATLEECVIHRNARGGILLAKDGADPILRGGNRIEDGLVRLTPQGPVKLAPVKKR